MTLVVVIAVIAVVIVVALVVLFLRRSSAADTPAVAEPPRRPIDEPRPMTGLESALERVTDRTGRPIRERLDDETGHIDDLRVPDDTGPLLRRALDHVEHPEREAAEGADTGADEGDGSDEAGGAEAP